MAKKEEATKPERVILLVTGESGAGKSLFIASIKNALIFDTDIGGGLAYLEERIKRNGSERVEAGSYLQVMDEITKRRRSGQLARINTLSIDHLSSLHQESVLRHNPSGGEDFGKSYEKANREWRKIREMVRVGDFNLACTAHLKSKYENQKAVGLTTDASKNIEADMMMVLYLKKADSYPSTAEVKKWRRDPEDPRGVVPRSFPFTLEKFLEIHGHPLDGTREEIQTATQEQIREVTRLLAVVRLEDGVVEKWFSKAKAESWEEMPADVTTKCIAHLKQLVEKGPGEK